MVEVHIPKKGIYGRLELIQRPEEKELPDDLELLRAMDSEESGAIERLEKSNRELAEALEIEDDPDFREAVADNLKVLERKCQRRAEIAEKIRQLTHAKACIPAGPPAAGYPVQAAAAAPAEAAAAPPGGTQLREDVPEGLAL
mmetsp:Transcript_157619/g.278183  ORF Transcript_157619/g.278183 Transcript_157619/m.278183 type:complete len:143 (-) Transcript_157619:68-496(-)